MPSMDLDDHGILAGSGLLRSKVFSQIENDILTGKYKPGESLTEMRLSEDMKVSRTPIREALRQLEHEEPTRRKSNTHLQPSQYEHELPQ